MFLPDVGDKSGRPGRLALGHLGNIGERERIEKLAHVCSRCTPDGEQDTLPFVVARLVGVRFTEISSGDGAVDGPDDLGELDVAGISGQDIAPADTTLRADEAGTLEREENLFKVRLWEHCPFCDLANRRRRGLGM